jgi:hypothetical protein
MILVKKNSFGNWIDFRINKNQKKRNSDYFLSQNFFNKIIGHFKDKSVQYNLLTFYRC